MSGTCLNGCSLSEASAAGLTADKLWHYDGTIYEELSVGGSEQFESWDGAWFGILPAVNGLGAKMLIPATNNLSFIQLPPVSN